MKILGFISVILVFTVIAGCKTERTDSSEKLISTQVVTNINSAEGEGNHGDLPSFKFESTLYDFGVIIQGEKVSYIYKFINSGGSDLVISNVKASCGCTIPTWSKEPIAPGGSGEIELVFDSSGKKGIQKKSLTVLANTQPNTTKLEFTAEVIVPGS